MQRDEPRSQEPLGTQSVHSCLVRRLACDFRNVHASRCMVDLEVRGLGEHQWCWIIGRAALDRLPAAARMDQRIICAAWSRETNRHHPMRGRHLVAARQRAGTKASCRIDVVGKDPKPRPFWSGYLQKATVTARSSSTAQWQEQARPDQGHLAALDSKPSAQHLAVSKWV